MLAKQLMDYGRFLVISEQRRLKRMKQHCLLVNQENDVRTTAKGPTNISPSASSLSISSPSASSTSTSSPSPSSPSASSPSASSPFSSSPSAYPPSLNVTVSTDSDDNEEFIHHINSTVDHSTVDDEEMISIGQIMKKYHDVVGNKHWVARYGKTVSQRSGKRYTMARKCNTCGKHTCCFCYQCGIPLCFSINSSGPSHGRNCFIEHVKQHFKKTERLVQNESSELVA